MTELFPTLQEIKAEAVNAKKPMLYMHDFYNVTGFLATPLATDNMLTKLVNCLVKGLNDHDILPRFVLIIPNTDLVTFIMKFNAGTTLLSSTAINWIVRQMS